MNKSVYGVDDVCGVNIGHLQLKCSILALLPSMTMVLHVCMLVNPCVTL